MTIYNCKCANNVNGLCYGNVSSSYQNEIQRGHNLESFDPVTEVNCPGYIAPGQPMYKGVAQGDTIIPPFN